jgi:hypothetical protein
MSLHSSSANPPLSECLHLYFVEKSGHMVPDELMPVIGTLENAIELGLTEDMLAALHGKQRVARWFAQSGREAVLDLFEVHLSVAFATDKLTFYKLGLIYAPGGDLRKAALLSDKTGIMRHSPLAV